MSTAASETMGALQLANIPLSLVGRNEEKAGNGCDVSSPSCKPLGPEGFRLMSES